MDNQRTPKTVEESPVMGSLIDMATFYRLETKVFELDNKVNGIESTLRSIFYQSYKILKSSNENINIIISKLENFVGEKSIITILED